MLSNEQLISYSKWAVSGYQQQCRYQKKPTHKKHIHIYFPFFRERKSSKCEESEMKKKKKNESMMAANFVFSHWTYHTSAGVCVWEGPRKSRRRFHLSVVLSPHTVVARRHTFCTLWHMAMACHTRHVSAAVWLEGGEQQQPYCQKSFCTTHARTVNEWHRRTRRQSWAK